MEHTHESRRQNNPSPVVPVGFLVHQKRLRVNHEQFFQNVTRCLDKETKGEFSATPKVLVSDQEFKTGIWDTTPVVHCWRHIQTDVAQYLKSKGKSLEDQNRAKRECRDLLSSRTPDTYEERLRGYLNKKEGPWRHKEFRRYFVERPNKVCIFIDLWIKNYMSMQ